MCTLVALFGIHPRFPLVLAANRDEFLDRPSAPPGVLEAQSRAVGGRDLEKGGTWLGVRPDGFFAGLTNLRPERTPRPALRSRGDAVVRVLRANGPKNAVSYLKTLDPSDFNGFNLLFGDASDLRIAYLRPDAPSVHIESVRPGLHELHTSYLDDPSYPKVSRIKAALKGPLPEEWEPLAAQLRTAMGDHSLPALEDIAEPSAGAFLDRQTRRELDAVCIHREGYGTRSATVMALVPRGVAHYGHAEGPPCVTEFADCLGLLAPRAP